MNTRFLLGAIAVFSMTLSAVEGASNSELMSAQADTTIGSGKGPGSVGGIVSNDSTKAGIEGATITLSPHFGKAGPGTADTTTYTMMSGPGGVFQFDSLSFGKYDITASAKGFVTGSTSVKVTAVKATVNLALRIEGPPTSNIIGTVKDSATGNPISGAKVTLRAGSGGKASTLDSTTTDVNGMFQLLKIHSSIASAPFALEIRKSGYQLFKDNAVVVADNATDTINAGLSVSVSRIVEPGAASTEWKWINVGDRTYLRILGAQGMEGQLEINSPDGRLLFECKVGRYDREIGLPSRIFSNKPLFARFTNGGRAVWEILLPARKG